MQQLPALFLLRLQSTLARPLNVRAVQGEGRARERQEQGESRGGGEGGRDAHEDDEAVSRQQLWC